MARDSTATRDCDWAAAITGRINNAESAKWNTIYEPFLCVVKLNLAMGGEMDEMLNMHCIVNWVPDPIATTLQEAAGLAGVTLNQFMIRSALEKATEMISGEKAIYFLNQRRGDDDQYARKSLETECGTYNRI